MPFISRSQELNAVNQMKIFSNKIPDVIFLLNKLKHFHALVKDLFTRKPSSSITDKKLFLFQQGMENFN